MLPSSQQTPRTGYWPAGDSYTGIMQPLPVDVDDEITPKLTDIFEVFSDIPDGYIFTSASAQLDALKRFDREAEIVKKMLEERYNNAVSKIKKDIRNESKIEMSEEMIKAKKAKEERIDKTIEELGDLTHRKMVLARLEAENAQLGEINRINRARLQQAANDEETLEIRNQSRNNQLVYDTNSAIRNNQNKHKLAVLADRIRNLVKECLRLLTTLPSHLVSLLEMPYKMLELPSNIETARRIAPSGRVSTRL